ncbi:MAG: hypothetical protein AAGJ52_01925 [Pseudomonadota bacterium]
MAALLDTRNNLLTVLLVGTIGVLGLGLGAQWFLMGRTDVNAIAPSGSTEVARTEVDVPETGLSELGTYGSITARPVFFSDRRLPVIEMPTEEELAAAADLEPIEEEPIEELRAAVAGIIITPELRLAMVRDDAMNKTFVLREGMSLEGEQAAWKLDSIDTRQVNFVSVDGRESLLELSVNTSSLAAGSSGLTPRNNVQEAQPGQEGDRSQPTAPDVSQQTDARSRAEEVRRRVAERRAELRAEADRRARLQQQQQRDN